MTAWLLPQDLADFVKNPNTDDSSLLQIAVDVAMAKAVELCGPVTPIQTITERRVKGGNDELPLRSRPTALTSVARYLDGSALNVADFDFEDQVLFRKDGGWISDDLTVVYESGYATVPPPIKALALAIGQQHLITMRKFGGPPGSADTAPVGFLVPKAALSAANDYLLGTF